MTARRRRRRPGLIDPYERYVLQWWQEGNRNGLQLYRELAADDQGHAVDAEQARKMVQYFDDTIRIMEIQIQTRQDGGYLPFADALLSAQEDEGAEQ